MRFASILALAMVTVVAGAAGLNAGCSADDMTSSSSSSGSSGTGCVDYAPPAGFDETTPTVSFATDILPIFSLSCAFSTCHGSTTGNANGVFLGHDAARVYAAINGVKGDENPTMPFVTPGDPTNSYLLRKMDASQCAIDAQCSGGSCQGSMPKDEASLSVDTRDKVRRWIAQGAKND